VTIRLFARLREIAGRDVIELDVPQGSSVQAVWTQLASQWPEMAAFGTTVSGAVNAEYARMSREVNDGDEVAFLPPVSGGAGF